MMKWQSRALVATGVLLILGLADYPGQDLLHDIPGFRLLVRAAALCGLLAAAVPGAITLGQIFLTGRLAFGVRAGLTYVLLAVVLLVWPGLFVIPHMVRLDVKRLLGVEPEDTPSSPA
jgi:hypothetical protein